MKTRNLILTTLSGFEPAGDGYFDMRLKTSDDDWGKKGYLEVRRYTPPVFANRLWHAIRADALTNCLNEAQTRFIWQAVLQIAGPVEIDYDEPVPNSLAVGDELLLVWEMEHTSAPHVPALHQVVYASSPPIGGLSLFSGHCVEYLVSDLDMIRDISMPEDVVPFMAYFSPGRS